MLEPGGNKPGLVHDIDLCPAFSTYSASFWTQPAWSASFELPMKIRKHRGSLLRTATAGPKLARWRQEILRRRGRYCRRVLRVVKACTNDLRSSASVSDIVGRAHRTQRRYGSVLPTET